VAKWVAMRKIVILSTSVFPCQHQITSAPYLHLDPALFTLNATWL